MTGINRSQKDFLEVLRSPVAVVAAASGVAFAFEAAAFGSAFEVAASVPALFVAVASGFAFEVVAAAAACLAFQMAASSEEAAAFALEEHCFGSS